MRTLILALAGLAFASGAHAATAPLKIASVGTTSGACAPLEGGAPAGEKAYYALLKQRLGRDILKCPVASRAEAATALSQNKVDVAVLDAASFEAVKATTRSILTVRPADSLNRIPIIVATKASGAPASLSALKGRKLAFGGSSRAALTTPLKALADQGLGQGSFTQVVDADGDAAAKSLRSGAADAIVVHASAWQRLCRGDKPNEDHCSDLKIVWRGRPRAALAMVIRRDMPDEWRFRLIGIHVAMHVEAKEAFAWASSWIPGGAEFEPTEADALIVAAR